jgi:hypothetical protein
MNGDVKQPDAPTGWQYKPGDSDPQSPKGTENSQATSPVNETSTLPFPEQRPEVSWNALEFIVHEKSPLWYLALIVVTLGLASLVLILSHDKVSTVLIIIVGIIFGVVAGRRPRHLQYLLDSKGITINRASRRYSEFKSFAVVEENGLDTIIFMPLKRFTLPLTINVDTNETDAVITKLSDYLPNDQTHGHDAIDKFMQRIHF